MADCYLCRSCEARLVGLSGVVAGDLAACPHCGATNWTGIVELAGTAAAASSASATLTVTPAFPEGQVIKVEQAQEHESAHSIPERQMEIELPTDEEMDRLEIAADSTVLGVLLHAPGEGDPETSWIAELMVDGQWRHTFRVGVVAEDAISDAAVYFAEHLDGWWGEVKKRRGRE